MLLINDSKVTFTAESRDSEDVLLASMTADYLNEDSIYFGIITYANSSIIDSDFSAFKEHVFSSQETIQSFINTEGGIE